jgi:hypothetical protein
VITLKSKKLRRQGMITLTKISILTGKENEMFLPITKDEYAEAEQARVKGMLIQEAYPTLSADQREFLISGSTPEEWEKMFGV